MKRFMRSFADRLTRRIILLWILMMAVVAAILFFRIREGMARQLESYYDNVLELTDEKVQTLLQSVEISAVNILEGVERNLSSPTAVFTSLEQELKLNSNLTGCGVCFIPNYFPAKGYWFEPYAVRMNDGHLVLIQAGSEQHDYFQSPLYSTPFSTGNGYWSEPYFDEAGAKTLVCTYSVPVHDGNGNTVAVLGADVSLDWLTVQMQEIDLMVNERSPIPSDEKYSTYSFLLDKDGDYITHPETARLLEKNYFNFSELDTNKRDTSYIHIGHEMLAGRKGQAKTIIKDVPCHVYYAPIEKIGWSVGIVVPRPAILRPGLTLGLFLLGMLLIGMVLIALASRYMIKRTARPLHDLAESAREVATGNFNTRLPEIRHDDEIRQLRDSFADMETSLSDYVRELTETTAQKASMESELAIARELQMSMLPKITPAPERDKIDIHASLTPAKAVGGDFYDFLIRNGRLFFCIGDVSGKGVPAAIVMSIISTQFRSLSTTEDKPEKIVSNINSAAEGRNESMMFATLFVGILDLSTGGLAYCNAGHNAPILTGKEPHFLKVKPNLPVGVETDWSYTGQHLTLTPGTTLLLYTDGLTEAENGEHDQFGEQRIFDTLMETGVDTPETAVSSLLDAVHQFVGEAEQSDDLTMLAIRFLGN